MLRQDIHIEKYDWDVVVFYAVTSYNMTAVMAALRWADCSSRDIHHAYDMIMSRGMNVGFTYSNRKERRTVMVVSLSSSAAEYCNSIAHERTHLAMNIAEAMGMNPWGEEVCYLVGDVAAKMWPVTHELVCEGCLRRLRRAKTSANPRTRAPRKP